MVSSRRAIALTLFTCFATLGTPACGSTPPPSNNPLTARTIASEAKAGVVRLSSRHGVGTGFILSPEGKIATNLHVIADAEAIEVELSDGRKYSVDRVLAVDEHRDLAVLKIAAPNLRPLRVGDSSRVRAGDPVVVIGNPLGILDFSISDGLVSSVRKLDEALEVIQTSAPISQGSSGGPLFNERGEVIGVTTFYHSEGQNLNFAIPANYLHALLTVHEGRTVPEFARWMRQKRSAEIPTRSEAHTPRIVRQVPRHDLAVLRGCNTEALKTVADGISEAIEIGAPLYNRGDHAACYVTYRNAAKALTADKRMCRGVRRAFGDGLKRSAKLGTPTEKAWAMRDTFDGLLMVIDRRLATTR